MIFTVKYVAERKHTNTIIYKIIAKDSYDATFSLVNFCTLNILDLA